MELDVVVANVEVVELDVVDASVVVVVLEVVDASDVVVVLEVELVTIGNGAVVDVPPSETVVEYDVEPANEVCGFVSVPLTEKFAPSPIDTFAGDPAVKSVVMTIPHSVLDAW